MKSYEVQKKRNYMASETSLRSLGVSSERLLRLDEIGSNRQSIGNGLRMMRELSALSLNDAALKLGIKPYNLRRMEAGCYNFGIDILGRACRIYGFKVDFIDIL